VIQAEGTDASGDIAGGLGYADRNSGDSGIENSIAIEFDTVQNLFFEDPNSNHISVHARPSGQPNSANETYSLYVQKTIPPLVGLHTFTVQYLL
jgi:hypothetical protein